MGRVSHLVVDNIKMERHDIIEQLGTSMSSFYGLENLEVINLSCSDHGGCCCLPVVGLEKHIKLKWLVLRQLSVESLKLPDMKRARISHIFVDNVIITDHCIEHIYKSVSSWYGIEQLEITNLSCSSHSARHCHPVLDLQEHIRLQRLLLRKLSVECMLLPDMEIARVSHLFLENVMITKRCIECIYTSVSSWSALEELHIIDLSCSVHHNDENCKPALDLAKHVRLQSLLLRQVSVGSLFLPDLKGTRVGNLVLDNIKGAHPDNIKQICNSLSSWTGLERLELINLPYGDQEGSLCRSELDLQNHHKLWWLVLRQLPLGQAAAARSGRWTCQPLVPRTSSDGT